MTSDPIFDRWCVYCTAQLVQGVRAVHIATRRIRPRSLVAVLVLMATVADAHAQSVARTTRPRIGVAFGGGSARGLAHVGVVRWFEEHHIPIDRVAGTSMGGLVGGAFCSGMSADDLTALLEKTDWDQMFGFTSFPFKNVRRKEDARIYPSRIELGAKKGLTLPLALNSGQQVDFLLARIAGPYMTLSSFDDLPTPFRAVAVDLVSSQQIVLDAGSLATAMRATMSLPGVFPPVEHDGHVLVDGGVLNNVPADVVRAMGADVVVAIDVSVMRDSGTRRSLVGLIGETLDVMMRANARASLKAADIVINPPLKGFDSLDWRHSAELAAAGYAAADALKDKLLPLAVSDTEWTEYQERRRTRRKTTFAIPRFVSVEGAAAADRIRIEELLRARLDKPLDIDALERYLETLTGLDRYETVGWQLLEVDGRVGLRVDARPKDHAPPFLMLGINLQNTTRDDFGLQLAARYLTFDAVGSGSELRLDAAIGEQPHIGAELYRPIRSSPLFVTLAAGARQRILNFVSDDVVVARYSEVRSSVGVDVGANLGRDEDVRVGIDYGRLNTNLEAGSPDLPELHGPDTRLRLAWRHDGQDSPVVPSRGVLSIGSIHHILRSPAPPPGFSTERTNDGITQAEIRGSIFWSPRQQHRAFLSGGAGTTWGRPLASEQFMLGTPLRLGAYDLGEIRGDNYAVLTLGYLRRVARLPDFLGGPIYMGGWVENGSAFDDIARMQIKTNVSAGAIGDTLIGPMLVGGSFAFNGAWRYYIAIGRLF